MEIAKKSEEETKLKEGVTGIVSKSGFPKKHEKEAGRDFRERQGIETNKRKANRVMSRDKRGPEEENISTGGGNAL